MLAQEKSWLEYAADVLAQEKLRLEYAADVGTRGFIVQLVMCNGKLQLIDNV